jgi:arsenate reductase (thioredoxin)
MLDPTVASTVWGLLVTVIPAFGRLRRMNRSPHGGEPAGGSGVGEGEGVGVGVGVGTGVGVGVGLTFPVGGPAPGPPGLDPPHAATATNRTLATQRDMKQRITSSPRSRRSFRAPIRPCEHGPVPAPAHRVIFACLHNAGRSQMAAAFFNQLADPKRAEGISAGTRPAARVHPEVVEMMREVGLDLSTAKPQRLTTELATGAGHLVTMGCGEECPYLPGVKVLDWPLPDPKGQPPERVREIRDDILGRVKEMIDANGWSRSRTASR